ncbi:MAG: GNAT family N-acetyltransferase, partial [Cytophagaceae bacterium]
MLTIIPPHFSYQDAFLRMLEDYKQHDPGNGEYYQAAHVDFAGYVHALQKEEQGVDLLPGMVPCSHRWLIDDGSVVGVVRIRHNIDTEYLAVEVGHIGYDVAPSMRGRGYGIAALQAGLARAQELGLERVLVCADTINPASWRTIERCGGVLEVEKISAHYGLLYRRYWVPPTPLPHQNEKGGVEGDSESGLATRSSLPVWYNEVRPFLMLPLPH